jgi:hypothetical protein
VADIGASNWNQTDASNTTAAPDGAPEGMAPSGVNDVFRAMMGAVKRWFTWTIPITTAGTTTAYTATYTVAPGALVDGMTHLIQFNATCGASPTLNVNSLGATPIHYLANGTWAVVPSGGILANTVAKVAYNSSAGTYRIVSSSVPIVPVTVSGSERHIVIGTTRIQMSEQASITAGGTATITFPIAFSSAPYVFINANGNSGSLTGAPAATNSTTTQFNLTNTGANTINYTWLAIGPV